METVRVMNNMVIYKVDGNPAPSQESLFLFQTTADYGRHIDRPSDDRAGRPGLISDMESTQAAKRAALATAAGMIQPSLLNFRE